MLALAEAGEVEDRRDHHQAADADALPLQLARDLRGAEATIAFPGDELDRRLPALLLDPLANEDRKRIGIAVDRPEAATHVVAARRDAAVARAGRIDEDEIGEVEPGLAVRHELRRRRDGDPVQRQPPRSYRAEIKIGRGRARPAIEHEGDRPTRIAAHHKGNVGDLGDERAIVAVVERDRAGGGLEPQRASGQVDGLVGGRVGRKLALRRSGGTCRRRFAGWRLGRGLGGRPLGALATLRQRGRRRGQARDQQCRRERSAAQEWKGAAPSTERQVGHEAGPANRGRSAILDERYGVRRAAPPPAAVRRPADPAAAGLALIASGRSVADLGSEYDRVARNRRSRCRTVGVLTESERALDSLFGAYSYRRTGIRPGSGPGQAFAEICASRRREPRVGADQFIGGRNNTV